MPSSFRQLLSQNTPIVFDGGMGTTLFDNGVFINRCFEQINLTDPDLVCRLHEAFVEAGAMVIETNTFGANRFKLAAFDLADRVRAINVAGVGIARKAAGDRVLVAGAVGPLGAHPEPLLDQDCIDAAFDAFVEHIDALAEGGVDVIILETFFDLSELKQALAAVNQVRRQRHIQIPVICSVTLNQEGNTLLGATAEDMVAALSTEAVDVVGLNCSVGPKPMLEALERIRKITTLPISVMPNAGLPMEIEGRKMYVSSPDYMANYARRFVQMGAQIVGGCCGNAPEHIRAISDSIRQMTGEKRSVDVALKVVQKDAPQPRAEIPVEDRSAFARKLCQGAFVGTIELTPPQGWGLDKILVSAQNVRDAGFDAINIPDGPRASARMGPLAMAAVIERETGVETIMHYACRDRNLVGMQADLLGAYALGLRNILVITGDPPIMGDYPHATAVFDVDAIGLTKMISRLNVGLDLSGRSIKEPTGFLPLVGLNPTAVNPKKELDRFRMKVEAGAKAVITQPVFDARQLLDFVDTVPDDCRVPIVAGIWPLQSLRNAEFLANEMPGVHVPHRVLERMQRAAEQGNERQVGKDIAIDIMMEVLPRIAGIQVAAPFGRIRAAIEVLDAAREASAGRSCPTPVE